MNRFILIIIFASFFLIGYSQRTAKVSATYTYYAPETMSVEEAKKVALDRAKIQAIADEFGTIVSQSTSTVITNKNGESDTKFFALGGSDIKGEWIETIGNPEYQLQFENHFLIVTCSVKGKAREIIYSKTEFTAKTLKNGTELRFEDVNFRDGDDLYLYFKSPTEGYLAVYLLDELSQTVYCVLPYKRQISPCIEINANQEYIFFAKEKAQGIEKNIVDEYTLSCDSEKEFCTLHVLFSTSAIGKGMGFDSTKIDKPENISLKEFNLWLSKNLHLNKSLQYRDIHITISK